MLATLADQPFSAADWIFERKLDGVRCLAFRSGSTVRLVSRNGHRMNVGTGFDQETLEALRRRARSLRRARRRLRSLREDVRLHG
jgi:ATP-dependent DNA ligase